MDALPMKVCVTGANGFVGSNLCRALIEKGHQVTGLVRPASDLEFIDNLPALDLRTGDITDPTSLRPAFTGTAIIYHVAGLASDWGDPAQFQAVNVDGVRNVMESAADCGVRRVIHVSSVSVYGFPGARDVAEDYPWIRRPDDPYVTSKQQGEELARSFNGHGVEVAVLRPAGLYGPNDRTTSLKLLRAMAARRLPYIDGGRHVMAPIYIDNFVQAAMLAADSACAPGRAYNVIDGGQTTWRQYLRWMCADLGCAEPPMSIPARIAWPLAWVVENLVRVTGFKSPPPVTRYRVRAVMRDSHYSAEKAERELGYNPDVPTREGVRRTVAWYRQYTAH